MGHDENRLAEIKATLYALPPDEFTAARNAAAKQASGTLARAVKALRRPTLAAWLVNLLAAHRADELTELLALGEQLRGAHQAMRGPELRGLSSRRQSVITSLMALARDLAAEHGRQVRDDTIWEAEATLRAALADPETAQQVRAGTLVRATEYSGLGPAAGLDQPDSELSDSELSGAQQDTDDRAGARFADDPVPVAPTTSGRRAKLRVILGGRSDPTATPTPAKRGTKSDAELRAERAAAALTAAERDLEDATSAEREATRRLGEIAAEFDELRIRERQLRAEQTEADRDRRRAQRRIQAAEKAAAEARRRLP